MDAADIAVVAALVIGYSLVARRLDRWSISMPLVFSVVGILVGDQHDGERGVRPNVVAGQRFFQRIGRRPVDLPAEIEPMYFRPDGGADGFDVE